MSGLVELGVISIRLAAEAIGDMALPEPLICGPTTAMTLLSATNSLVLVAAWAGSYWPAATVPSSLMTGLILIWPAMPPRLLISSMAISAPSRMLAASAASAPVNGKLIPIEMLDGYDCADATWVRPGASDEARVATAISGVPKRRTNMCILSSCRATPRPVEIVAGIVVRGLRRVNVRLRQCHAGEGALGRGHERIGFGFGHRRGHAPGQLGCEDDAFAEHLEVEALHRRVFFTRGHRRRVVGDRPRVRMQLEQAARAGPLPVDAVCLEQIGESLPNSLAEQRESLVLGRRQHGHGLIAGHHRHGIGVEGPTVRDAWSRGAGGIEHGHHLGPSAEGADGEAAADDLAERRQVGGISEPLLCTAICDAERDDLVRNQQDLMLASHFSEPLKKAWFRVDKTWPMRERVYDDGGQLTGVLRNESFHGLRVVEWEEEVRVSAFGVRAVIAALEAGNARPAGERAGRLHRHHHRFGARIGEAHLFETLDTVDEHLRQTNLGFGRKGQRGTQAELPNQDRKS